MTRKNRKKFLSEQEKIKMNRECINEWYKEFSESKSFRKLHNKIKYIISFAVYVSREYLFAWDSPKCSEITPEKIEKFFLETIPCYITTDRTDELLDAQIVWFQWLINNRKLSHSKSVLKIVRGIGKKAGKRMEDSHLFSASKSLVIQAIEDSVDLSESENIVEYFLENSNMDKDYLEEFLNPPHPIFYKGRYYYIFDWKTLGINES